MLVFFAPTLLIGLIIPTITSPSASYLMHFVNVLFVAPFVTGASIFYAYQNLTQRGATVPASLEAAGEKFLQLSLLTVLCFTFLIPTLFIFQIPALILVVIPAIYLSFRWSFVFYAVVVEGYSVLDALRRSWKLTGGNWWLIFRTGLLFTLALIVPIVFLVFIIFGLLRPDLPGLAELKGNLELIGNITVFLISPFLSIYYVLLFMSLVNLAVDNNKK